MGIGNIGGSYFNFILGTGTEDVAKMIKHQVKNRKANGQNYVKALYTGTKKGIGFSHGKQVKAGGYLKSLKNGFSAIPNGWKSGKGIFGKPWGAIKGLGKAMPAVFGFLTILGEVPNIYKATKEKGFVQGLKETGKTAARLTTGALFAAVGSAICPVVGSFAGWMIGDFIASKIVGKSYSEQVANKPEEQDKTAIPVDDGFSTAATTGVGSGGYVQYPSIDINDFGPHRPYANIFFNNPAAYADIGARMPGQEGLVGYTYSTGVYPMMGFVGSTNNRSGNLLEQNGGNLLTPTGAQNAYAKQQTTQGSKLNIVSE